MDEITFHTRLHRPGTLLDVGAHDGLITLPFARLPDSRVLAFEPLPPAFARLEAAIRAAFGTIPPHVTLVPEALGDATGSITLAMPVLDGVAQEQWASTAKDYEGYDPARIAVSRFTVPVRRIDDLGLTDLTHVKLDAEGAEYAVLRGARETLLRCRPVLTIEIEERHRQGSTWAVPAFLDALGYDTIFELDGAWHPMAALDRATMQRASPDPSVFEASDPYVFVFYALPRESAAAMLARFENQPIP
ncbi:FkbM family methyltransferase [Plastoroseomonas hellenica]|uniref:FkbM family methyltransferase n=1 Tax=Plastoroseomonas hellenica TaxID=2687306 RepID=UPI001BA96279|nr:FkbM family methyltransferase [Plastoroseomonas hellenica]MBR0647022.1 FkbM family methyltransferase [Plastoroseomonas hellenica]